MKLCKKCNNEKCESDFHKRKASKDGLAHICKECQREYDRARLHDPKRMKARRDYQKTEAGKKAHNRATKAWADRNAVKRAAHVLVGNAIRDGRLTPEPCEVCFKTHDTHAHHDDYAKPLEVRWLCSKHHSEWHRENGEALNAK